MHSVHAAFGTVMCCPRFVASRSLPCSSNAGSEQQSDPGGATASRLGGESFATKPTIIIFGDGLAQRIPATATSDNPGVQLQDPATARGLREAACAGERQTH